MARQHVATAATWRGNVAGLGPQRPGRKAIEPLMVGRVPDPDVGSAERGDADEGCEHGRWLLLPVPPYSWTSCCAAAWRLQVNFCRVTPKGHPSRVLMGFCLAHPTCRPSEVAGSLNLLPTPPKPVRAAPSLAAPGRRWAWTAGACCRPRRARAKVASRVQQRRPAEAGCPTCCLI